MQNFELHLRSYVMKHVWPFLNVYSVSIEMNPHVGRFYFPPSHTKLMRFLVILRTVRAALVITSLWNYRVDNNVKDNLLTGTKHLKSVNFLIFRVYVWYFIQVHWVLYSKPLTSYLHLYTGKACWIHVYIDPFIVCFPMGSTDETDNALKSSKLLL